MFIARLMHFYCAFETISEHPFIGVGFNAHLEYIRNNINPDIFTILNTSSWRPEEFIFSNPIHNIFLIFLTELGIIGIIPIIVFITKKFTNIKKQLRREASVNYHIAALFAIGVLCYLLVHGMSDWAPMNAPMRNIWIFAFFIVACVPYSKSFDKNT